LVRFVGWGFAPRIIKILLISIYFSKRQLEFFAMSDDIKIFVALSLAHIVGLFFWCRGIVKNRKSDYWAGLAILTIIWSLIFFSSGSSGVFEIIGQSLIIFGVINLTMSYFAKPVGTLKKSEIQIIGVGAIIAGLALSVIM
jgi:hypothetical protein